VNVLLVVLDSVRAANCGLYGHRNDTTPRLEELAEDATVYDQARAPAIWSLPSHVSMFTGRHATEHLLTVDDRRLAGVGTIWERLRDAGYATGVFSDNVFLTGMETGLAAGFDHVAYRSDRTIDQAGPFADGMDIQEFAAIHGEGEYHAFLREVLGHDRPIRSVINGIVAKVSELINKSGLTGADGTAYVDAFTQWATGYDDWAACVNLMEAHAPWEPEPHHDRWSTERAREITDDNPSFWAYVAGEEPRWELAAMETVYDGCIHEVDALVGQIVDWLRDTNQYDDTLLIVTADHGEELGEPSPVANRPVVGHRLDAAETQFHVPLVLK